MTADDAQASGQAREVEVRLVGEAIEDAAMRLKGRDLGTVHRDQIAREALDAIEHIRAAERQEAARAAAERAWDEGVRWVVTPPESLVFGPPNPYRADGVTGREDV